MGDHRRRKRATTDAQYNGMLRRMIGGWSRRAEENIEANLAEFRTHQAAFEDAANLAIYRANRHGGVSINRIAASLRVSKQAAHKRVLAGERIARQQPQRWDFRLTAARPRELPRRAAE